ncbi:hypothetical protein J6590_099165 [Homalodisca vitripennis]|nr:hypothetical protein J6590_074423 [Homalodisca vitripennis]KAG8328908.1 hypothetical protein J6590_099165 [Homalodisca vitripennis]
MVLDYFRFFSKPNSKCEVEIVRGQREPPAGVALIQGHRYLPYKSRECRKRAGQFPFNYGFQKLRLNYLYYENYPCTVKNNDGRGLPHPVAMRRLSMPQRSPSAGAPCSLPLVAAPTVSPSLPSQTCSTTPTVTHVVPTSTSTPAAPTSAVAPDMSTPVVSLSPHYSILDTSSTSTLQPELPTIENLVKENTILQEQIAELKEQLRHVIDHTIENDKRLLQYTGQIFIVNSPQSVMTPRASVADFGTQCDLPAICMDEQCVNGRADINNLRANTHYSGRGHGHDSGQPLAASLTLRTIGCGHDAATWPPRPEFSVLAAVLAAAATCFYAANENTQLDETTRTVKRPVRGQIQSR